MNEVPFPSFDERERRILEEIRNEEGDIFRTDLRAKMGGSNTTFIEKVESLKRKGMLEEYKRREGGTGRYKTAYRFTEYASRLFHLEQMLSMHRWFSASQKIELFPEFDRIAREILGDRFNVYEMLGIEPQHMFLETLLATSHPPAMAQKQVEEVLGISGAFFQNMVTGKLHPKIDRDVEGYIIFHFKLEQPEEEFQNMLLRCLMDYVKSSDALKRHRACSRLVELAIKDARVLPMTTMAAMTAAGAMKLNDDLKDLRSKYDAYKKGEAPMQLTRIQLAVSVLNIFKRLYDEYRKKNGDTDAEGVKDT